MDLPGVNGATILQRKKKIVKIGQTETLLMLRSYVVHPTNWGRIIENITQNIDQLPADAKELYRNGTLKQLRDRLSGKLGKLMAEKNIENKEIRNAMQQIKNLESRLLRRPGDVQDADFRDNIAAGMSDSDEDPATPAREGPGPAAPARVGPGPAAPAPVGPGPAATVRVVPGPAAPARVGPGPAAPARVVPGPTAPVRVGLGPAAPTRVGPGPAAPARVGPGPAAPARVVPGPAAPARGGPGPAAPVRVVPGPPVQARVGPAQGVGRRQRKRPLADLIRENHERYNRFIRKKIPKLLRQLGVSSDSSDTN